MNTETNFMSFENLTKLIEEHKKETHPYKRYEFDSTSYTLLLISINNLIKENQELKSKLELYENGVYFSSEVDEKDKQIDKLNKKYENAVADYEKIEFEKEQLNRLVNSCQEEIRQLKKQLEEKENIACNWKNSCLENAGKIDISEIQQKEFINYLEDKIYTIEPKGTSINFNCEYDSEEDYLRGIRRETSLKTLKENLQKYKETIGGNKDE